MPKGPKIIPPSVNGSVAVKDHVYTAYEEQFPLAEGPPPVAHGRGAAALKQRGQIEVSLDEGAFRAVWELVEMSAKARWEVRNVLEGSAALVRAVEAFRRAYRPAGGR